MSNCFAFDSSGEEFSATLDAFAVNRPINDSRFEDEVVSM